MSLKKVGTLFTLMLTLPALANAWQITARVPAGQGSVADGSTIMAAAPVPTPAPPYTLTYANTLDTKDLTVTPATGYYINSVLIDGAAATAVAPNTYRISYSSINNHTINANFAIQKFSVTNSQRVGIDNGTFTVQQTAPTVTAPTTGNLSNVPYNGKIKVVATPKAGFTVSKITVGTTDYSVANGNAVLGAGGALTASNITITSAVAVSATYAPIASISVASFAVTAPSLPMDTAKVTFAATASGNDAAGAKFDFEVKDSGGAVVSICNTATPPVCTAQSAVNDTDGIWQTPSILPANLPNDSYTATVTAKGPSGTTSSKSISFTVLNSLTATTNSCTGCHSNSTPSIVSGFMTSAHAESTGHDSARCFRCHNDRGPLFAETTAYTGNYAFINATSGKNPNFTATAPGPISCAICHTDAPHAGEFRSSLGWNPNNGASTAQYDLCTSCHGLTDDQGLALQMYHEKGSINTARIITDTHFDNISTGVGKASTTIEGYVVRANSAHPCADCHNVHSADLEIQEQWAKSGHAGKLLAQKEEALCAASIPDWNAIPANATKQAPAGAVCTDIVPQGTRSYLETYMRTANGVATAKAAGVTGDSGPAWEHYNWDAADRQACQHCHTATGASNYLSNRATYNAANNSFSHLSGRQNEVLYCWGCHSDAGSGALRNTGSLMLDYKANAADTANIVIPAVGNGNSTACFSCHMGRGNVASLMSTAAIDPAAALSSSSTPKNYATATSTHYLNAGATIFKNETKVGYEFPGKNYANPVYFEHNTVGCTDCHMSGAESHSFEVVSKDASGAITALNATNCVTCHTGEHGAALTTEDLTNEFGSFTPAGAAAFLEEEAAGYNDAMAAFNDALINKGYIWTSSHPYFMYDFDADKALTNADKRAKFTHPTTKAVSYYPVPDSSVAPLTKAAGWTDVNSDGIINDLDVAFVGPLWPTQGDLGAAHNYNYLLHEPGAYAHNRLYAKRLIYDSIDWLDNGALDGSVVIDAGTYPEAAIWLGAARP